MSAKMAIRAAISRGIAAKSAPLGARFASSLWGHVDPAPKNPILGVTEAFLADPSPNKVNVGVGAYRDDDGKPVVLECVRKAEAKIAGNLNMEYLPMGGSNHMVEETLKLAYGDDSEFIKDKRIAAVQALSGTGACRLFADFQKRYQPESEIYIPVPTWSNHHNIWRDAHVSQKTYHYYHPESRGLDFSGMMEDIKNAPKGSFFLLHACAHNPTGVDPTEDQWKEISQLIKEKGHFPFFDMAYQGFASGDPERDAKAIRIFLEDGHLLGISQSFAKNMGLYGQRVGCLSVLCDDEKQAVAVKSRLQQIARPMYSNPPVHGALIVSIILSDPDLKNLWLKEVKVWDFVVSAQILPLLLRRLYELNSTHYFVILRNLKLHPISVYHFSLIPRKSPISSPFSTKPSNELSNLCSRGNLKEAFSRFKAQIWSDPNLFSVLIQGCVSTKSLSWAKQLHALIITSGCFLDKFLNNHLMNMYGKFGEMGIALALFKVNPKKNIMSCNILINGFVQSGDLESAQKVFDEMPQRNVATWNAIVTGMMQFEKNERGLDLFSQMHKLGFCPDEFTLGSVLRGCAGLKVLLCGRQVHAYATKNGYEETLIVGSAVANMYMRCKSLEEGERVIRGMHVHSVAACNTLIAGRAQNGCPEGALDHYNLMKKAGFQPDRITFTSVLSSCSDLATLGQGQQIHAEAIKRKANTVVSVVSSLISMYSRCGCLPDSIKAFEQRKEADIVLWSSMIAAYGFHGKGEEAIELFNEMMREGFEANEVTFLSLLYACSHCGLKDKGLEYLDIMVEEYRLKPRLEHYTCVVDLLGRSGCLSQAEDMIRTMPIKADAVIWKTLLSACKTHKKVDMAKRISEEIHKLDPLDSASYIILSNIQASAKKWDEVSIVRKTMRDRRLKKEPGISWFEFKNEVHRFVMRDKSHPRWREIDIYLKELMTAIKKVGYVPYIESILHEMENEEKEYDLAHHSEKLAIAFALMTTPSGFPIRVMKNLRVCDDCHSAIKYISEVKDREIIVRDASRFHHFKGGVCSCGDYW